MSFSDILNQSMADKKITKTQLAELSGLSKAAIGSYCSGKYEPRRETIEKLFDILEERKAKPKTNYDEIKEAENAPFVFSDKKIDLRTAANVMHMKEHVLRQKIINGEYNFAEAYKNITKWSFYISPIKFYEYTGWRY